MFTLLLMFISSNLQYWLSSESDMFISWYLFVPIWMETIPWLQYSWVSYKMYNTTDKQCKPLMIGARGWKWPHTEEINKIDVKDLKNYFWFLKLIEYFVFQQSATLCALRIKRVHRRISAFVKQDGQIFQHATYVRTMKILLWGALCHHYKMASVVYISGFIPYNM